MGICSALRAFGLLATLLLSACVSHPTMTVTKNGESAKVYVRPLQPVIGPDGIQLAGVGPAIDWFDYATYKSMGALPKPIPKPNMSLCLFADVATTAVGLSTGRMVELNPLGPYGATALATGTLGYLSAVDDGSDYWLDMQHFYANVHCGAAAVNGAGLLIFALLL